MSDTIKHWCDDCDELHRVPAHLRQHSLCCVDCGGALRDSFDAPRERRKARKQRTTRRAGAPRRATRQPEPVLEPAGGGTRVWLKRSAPFMLAAVLLACAALIKISAGHSLPALASAMFCLVSCLRIFLIYREEVQGEEVGFMTALA